MTSLTCVGYTSHSVSCRRLEGTRRFSVTYLEVNFKLHVFLNVLEKTLLFVVGELEGELGPKRHKHVQQQADPSQKQHRESRENRCVIDV